MADPTTSVFVTHRIKEALDAEVARHQVKQEGLVHAILTLALTDPQFLAKAVAFDRHLGDLGATKLANMGL